MTSFVDESARHNPNFFPEYTHPIAVPDTRISQTPEAVPIPTKNDDSQVSKNVHKLLELMNMPLPNSTGTSVPTSHENVPKAMLSPLVSLFLAQEGFVAANAGALDVLVDMFENYLLRFGKVLNSQVTTNTNQSDMINSLYRASVEMNPCDAKTSIFDLKNVVEQDENEMGENLASIEQYKKNPVKNQDTVMEE